MYHIRDELQSKDAVQRAVRSAGFNYSRAIKRSWNRTGRVIKSARAGREESEGKGDCSQRNGPRGVKRIELQKRESGTERTSRNKTVISRHFTHERERLTDSTCVPVLGTLLSTAWNDPPLFPIIALSRSACTRLALSSRSIFLPCSAARPPLSILLPYSSITSATLVHSSLKNTALADTCSFHVLHMCVTYAVRAHAHRGNEGQEKKRRKNYRWRKFP